MNQKLTDSEWREVAQQAYMAYAASTGNKNFRGDTMPEFAVLPKPIIVAWIAAVRHASQCLAVVVARNPEPPDYVKMYKSDFPPDPKQWSGWLPDDMK